MGKWTDKVRTLYITHSEWQTEFGGAKKKGAGSEFKRLPFYCCALSMQPLSNPVCTDDGTLFDLLYILPWLKKHGSHPVTGQPLTRSQLFPVIFHKNASDEYNCPVTFKVFSEHSHIVVIKPTGNVYSYEAVERFNVKAKNWKDLLTEEPFTREDIITIQNPHELSKRNINEFDFVKKELDIVAPDKVSSTKTEGGSIKNSKGTLGRVLDEMGVAKTKTILTPSFVDSAAAKPHNAAQYSNGIAGASFTSTSLTPQSVNKAAMLTEEEYVLENFPSWKGPEAEEMRGKDGKKNKRPVKDYGGKGYARISTNLGDINIELFCRDTPRTCYNFLMLAKKGYYNNVQFHRLIKDFMIQGGDPTGTGKGGTSIWGEKFGDEWKNNLKHEGPGVLSMANSGPNTNGSQFFITFKSCPHLDGKHTVFGKVVGGYETLNTIQTVKTDAKDRPKPPITVLEIQIFSDPIADFANALKARQETLGHTQPGNVSTAGTGHVGVQLNSNDDTVGKYLKQRKREAADEVESKVDLSTSKRPKTSKGFGDFSGW
ncbi:peptidyl-prolyl cis-trans isomerase-like 2 [Cladochytrium replicatum]|nr:peptidyl-prolyl cis-trans isomerase-like 2 [Cladochytrium replicatum]